MPTFALPTEVAEEEEKEMQGEVVWGEDDWDEEEDESEEEEEEEEDGATSPPGQHPQQQRQQQGRRGGGGRGGGGGDGMCLMGQYLLGSLFGGLCGFVTKRIAFREVAAGAAPYSWTLFGLDVLMGLVAGMAVLGASASFPPSRPSSSSSSPSAAPGGYTYVPVTTNASPSSLPSSLPSSSFKIITHSLVLFAAVNASVVGGFLLLALRRALGPTLLLYFFLHNKGKSGTDDDALSPSWLLLQAGLATAAAVNSMKFLLSSPRGKAILELLGRSGGREGGWVGGAGGGRGGGRKVAMRRMEMKV